MANPGFLLADKETSAQTMTLALKDKNQDFLTVWRRAHWRKQAETSRLYFGYRASLVPP